MRSRWMRTTSTGETALVAISPASSVMDAQNKSAMSDRPIVRGGLGVDRDRLERAQEAQGRLDVRTDRLQLCVAPGKAGQPGAVTEGVEIDGS